MDFPSPAPSAQARRDNTGPRAPRHAGFVQTRLRLISGLTLFTFVLTHLANHALGLVSLDVMRAGQAVFFLVWHSLPGALLLSIAALTHLSLVLYKQIVRPTLRMPWIEGLRILLGIVTLLGLSLHATPMVIARIGASGQPVSYPDFIQLLISGSPMLWNQLILVIAAWTHGCIGVHLWLRLRGGYRRHLTLLAITAVLVPLLALLGLLAAARAVQVAGGTVQSGGYGDGGGNYGSYGTTDSGYGSAGGGYGAGAYGGGDSGGDGANSSTDRSGGNSLDHSYGDSYGSSYSGGYSSEYGSAYGDAGSAYGAAAGSAGGPAAWLGWLIPSDAHSAQSVHAALVVIALLILATLARGLIQTWDRRHGLVSVRYPQGREVKAVRGASVLEISRMGGVPHASVCGGRGRCSTCRVHVDVGWETLPPPREGEQRVLQRIKAPARVRLACQLCPQDDLAVTPLLAADARAQDALPYDPMKFGAEQEIVILFADLRGFTQMSENKLPFDVVHILNQYFSEMGEAIESTGGYLDKFIGDGIMALFGLRQDAGNSGRPGVETGARQAVAAARAMGERLQALNARLAQDLATPLRLGLGIHAGHAIVGEMGYGHATSLTAIGDAVNVASRLESATKEVGCELLISTEAAQRGRLDLSAFETQQIGIRGREGGLDVYVVRNTADLAQFQEA